MEGKKGESSFVIPEICKRVKAIKAAEKNSKKKERDVKKVLLSKRRYLKNLQKKIDKFEDENAALEIEEKSLVLKQNASAKTLRVYVAKGNRIALDSWERDLAMLSKCDEYGDKLEAMYLNSSMAFFHDIFARDANEILEALARTGDKIKRLQEMNQEDTWASSELDSVVSDGLKLDGYRLQLEVENKALEEEGLQNQLKCEIDGLKKVFNQLQDTST